jgi:hypothetical protein
VARNAVGATGGLAIYICMSDRTHLMSRLMCLESAEQGYGEQALTRQL